MVHIIKSCSTPLDPGRMRNRSKSHSKYIWGSGSSSREDDSWISRMLYDQEDYPAKYAHVRPAQEDLEAYQSYKRNEVLYGDEGSSSDTIVPARTAVSV